MVFAVDLTVEDAETLTVGFVVVFEVALTVLFAVQLELVSWSQR